MFRLPHRALPLANQTPNIESQPIHQTQQLPGSALTPASLFQQRQGHSGSKSWPLTVLSRPQAPTICLCQAVTTYRAGELWPSDYRLPKPVQAKQATNVGSTRPNLQAMSLIRTVCMG